MMQLMSAVDRQSVNLGVVHRASAGEADFCSREGAQALKQKIEAYWRERGHDVQIILHNVGFHPAIRAARFDVRSDMVNGLPQPTKHGGRTDQQVG